MTNSYMVNSKVKCIGQSWRQPIFLCIFGDPAFEANLHGAAIDLEVNPRVFDLTTPGGFVTLGA